MPLSLGFRGQHVSSFGSGSIAFAAIERILVGTLSCADAAQAGILSMINEILISQDAKMGGPNDLEKIRRGRFFHVRFLYFLEYSKEYF
jgi:hypothetical protein